MATYSDESLMPFGKFKGQKLANVPAYHLLWIYDNLKSLELGLKIYIRENREALEKENKK